jgi:hypothetical protein
MKAAFTLTPAESKRLIAKAIVQMPEVKAAWERAYIILPGGTTNAIVAQELVGQDVVPGRFTAGICTHGLLCVTNPGDRQPFPIIIHKGQVVNKTLREALDDFHRETIIIKGANAIDAEGNIGVITSGFDGGTVAAMIGTVTSQGLQIIAPVGLEKFVRSVRDSAIYTGAKTLDYTIGADFGMYALVKAKPVTEIEALRILFGVEAKHVASGGIGGSEGAVVLIVMGEEAAMKKAIALVESIKGEKPLVTGKGTCATCRYACRFHGTKEEDLPGWLKTPPQP